MNNYLKVQGKSYKGNQFTESSVFQQGDSTYTYSKLKQGHPDVPVDFTSVNGKVGFKWNQEEECFEMVVDEQTWDLNVPVEMFIKKLTQQYALTSVVSAVKQEGFQIAEQYVNPVDQAVELVCTRWE